MQSNVEWLANVSELDRRKLVAMVTSIPIESLSMSAEMAWAFLTVVATMFGMIFVPRG